jgi:AcrR family transcriptional regulator
MAKKEDIRVTKTKRALRKAIVSLMERKDFDKITVCDICEEASINRMTFYKHYMDKFDLMSDLLDFLSTQLKNSYINKEASKLFFGDPSTFLSFAAGKTVDFFVAYESFFRIIVKVENSAVSRMVYEAMRKTFAEFLTEYCKYRKSKYSVDNIAVFFTGGVSRLTVYLFESKEDEKSREDKIAACKKFFKGFLSSDLFFEPLETFSAEEKFSL